MSGKTIGDHEQIPYLRCKKCNSINVPTKQGKVIKIPKYIFVKSGDKPSKSPTIQNCSNCGAPLNVPVHHQAIPCVGDLVSFPADSNKLGGETLTGIVKDIAYDNKTGIPSKVTVEYIGIAEMSIFMVRLMRCHLWKE